MFLSFFIWLTQVLAHGIYDFHFGMWGICFDFLVSALAATCGIQFPEQELNLGPLPWECRVLATGPPEKSLVLVCLMIYISGEIKLEKMHTECFQWKKTKQGRYVTWVHVQRERYGHAYRHYQHVYLRRGRALGLAGMEGSRENSALSLCV